MDNYLDFSNKVVVVTGNSGAGKKIADVFKEAKATVITTYHNKPTLQEHCYQLDISSVESIDNFVNTIYQIYGHIDVLVNNAGIYPSKEIKDINETDFDQMFDVNTKGTFFLSQKIAERMDKGSIINISSINATNPAVKLTTYGASKAAVEFLTKSLAYNYGPNIRVNCIAPGLIYRENIEQFIGSWVESYQERSALKRLVKPEEIGKTALFLASDLASAITGQIITVDCGVTLAPAFNNQD